MSIPTNKYIHHWIRNMVIESEERNCHPSLCMCERAGEGFASGSPSSEREMFLELARIIGQRYVMLPTDSDGKPYYIGEIIWSTDPSTGYSAEILDISVQGELEIEWSDGTTDVVQPTDMTHKHPDTIDILLTDMDMAAKQYLTEDDPMNEEVVQWIERINNMRESGVI